MKTCFKCGTEKPLSEFYKHPQMKDGHVNKCKECNKLDVRENRTLKVEYYQAYDRARGSRQSPEYSREYYRKNKEKVLEAQRRKRKENPEQYVARYTVRNAVRAGKLVVLPCEVCGSEENIHGHHEDYSKPLDVRWLCPIHHGEAHRIINEKNRKNPSEEPS